MMLFHPSPLPSRAVPFPLSQNTTAPPSPRPILARAALSSLTILTLSIPPRGATPRRRAHVAPRRLLLAIHLILGPLLTRTGTGPRPPLRPRLRPRIRPVHVPQAPLGLDHVTHAALELLGLGEAAVGFAVPEAGGGGCGGGRGGGGSGGGGGDELNAKDAAEAGLEGDFGEGVGKGGEEFLGVLRGVLEVGGGVVRVGEGRRGV